MVSQGYVCHVRSKSTVLVEVFRQALPICLRVSLEVKGCG
jgi:hypothetical protein